MDIPANAADQALLARVSGIGAGLAQGIVQFRDANGPFKSRKALKEVPRLGPKAFEQCAGFLRINGGTDPLDASGVHPESYPVVERILAGMAEGRVAEVVVSDRSMTGRLKSPDGGKSVLITTRVEPDLAARLEKYNVPYTRVVESTWLRELASWIVPALVFFGLW